MSTDMYDTSQRPTLRVRINQIDYTTVQPGDLDNSSLSCVPVIRVFGNSSTGEKACVHIHQVYPYFFVEYTARLDPNYVNRYITKLTQSLNHAIALSLKRNPQSPHAQYIRAILLVKGVHFYGFHSSYSPFLKILVADPAYINRIVTIMQSGTVMSTRFRVFESHLSFILQFMCDFSLYGCGWMDLSDAWQRGAEDSNKDEAPNETRLGDVNPVSFNVSSYFRQSRMPLEVDVIAPQILNRHRVSARHLHHKLEIPALPVPAEPLVLSIRELWDDERDRRRANGLNPSPEIPVDPSDSSRGVGGGWIAEARWWDEIRRRIEREREMEPEFNESGQSWERRSMTVFESVEALWDKCWKVWKPEKQDESMEGQMTVERPHNTSPGLGASSAWNVGEENPDEGFEDMGIDVDVSLLSAQDMSQPLEFEEEEQNLDLHDDKQSAQDEELYEDEVRRDEDDQPRVSQDSIVKAHTSSPPDPFHEKEEANTPKQVHFKLPRLPDFDPEMYSDDPVTPTKPGSLNFGNLDSPDGTPTSKGRISVTSDEDVAGDEPQRSLSPASDGTNSLRRVRMQVDDDESRPSKRRRLVSGCDLPAGSPGIFFVSPPPPSALLLKHQPSKANFVRVSHAVDRTKSLNLNRFVYAHPPPTIFDLLGSLDDSSISSKLYRTPYYSRGIDVPGRPREYGGLMYHLKGGEGITNLEEWNDGPSINTSAHPADVNPLLYSLGVGGWEYASGPPSVREVRRWLTSGEGKVQKTKQFSSRSQIEGPTQANIYGLKDTPEIKAPTASREKQVMTVLSLEVFAPTRDSMVPNAVSDEIVAAFYSYQPSETSNPQNGIIVVQNPQLDPRRLRHIELDVVFNEIDLINRIVDTVVDLDPDIIVGWEVQRASWGYLDSRGQQLGFDVADLISRAPLKYKGGAIDQWGMRHNSTFKVAGRHVLNLWRIMRSEQNLNVYTFENIVFNILHKRVPRYSFPTLTEWYNSTVPAHAATVMRYFSDRASMVLDILEEAQVITKTAEFARVFGVDFFSVISRGSQFKVESFMFRIAKPESFVLLSPSKADVGRQNAAECMPLIMEPMSAFYSSPLVVLDFQSLYPSIMIAYNYCYSTCLGRITDFQGKNKLGVVDLDQPPGLLEKLNGQITIAPNGMVYVKPTVRKGLLGRMLVELLETRIMVKQAMKGVKNDKNLRRILDARQLSLKYISNVTYGYTSATYSGRMPAVEIADSIVQSGRETLEKAIMLINGTKKWGAEVVYGDTDSVFVYLRGKTKDQAFRIGNDIADTITALNPAPVKLKFEKVYLPCILMAKKRYVGFKYETVDDKDPVFDAKGIETVRRDGVLAQQKMTENCLKILFRTQDLSEVKDYCYKSWTKLLENKASPQDFIFAKEVRMGTYSDKVPPPPGVAVAARRMVQDPNNEPEYGERVPYVITQGQPGTRVVDRAVDPLELLNNSQMRLDAVYYISRVLIPPLERIFNLVGADVRQWFTNMPKMKALEPVSPSKNKDNIGVVDIFKIEEHFHRSQCIVCGEQAIQGLCDNCLLNPAVTMTRLSTRIQVNEARLVNAHRICASCAGCAQSEPIRCESLDCPWLYSRKKAEGKMELLAIVRELLGGLETGNILSGGLAKGSSEGDNPMPKMDDNGGSDTETSLP